MLILFVSLITILIIFFLLFKYVFKYKSGFLLFYIKYILIFNTSAYIHALKDLLSLLLNNSLSLNTVSSTLLQTIVVLIHNPDELNIRQARSLLWTRSLF
jgi:hypothetical protein